MLERTPAVARPGGGGSAGGGLPPFGDDGGRGGAPATDPSRLGLWFFLGTVAMLFIGFTSAYMVRRASADWQAVAMPPLLWVNTLVLAASSVAVEAARRKARAGRDAAAQRTFTAAFALGLLFAAGQVAAWRTLAATGVFLTGSPHAAFLYVLTGVHLVHVTGGLGWAARAQLRLHRGAGDDALALFATYWHFLGALWLYLLALLFVL